jgi:hypothetical protein
LNKFFRKSGETVIIIAIFLLAYAVSPSFALRYISIDDIKKDLAVAFLAMQYVPPGSPSYLASELGEFDDVKYYRNGFKSRKYISSGGGIFSTQEYDGVILNVSYSTARVYDLRVLSNLYAEATRKAKDFVPVKPYSASASYTVWKIDGYPPYEIKLSIDKRSYTINIQNKKQ